MRRCKKQGQESGKRLKDIIWRPHRGMQEDGRDQDGTNPANRNISNTGAKESAKKKVRTYCQCGIGHWLCRSCYVEHVVGQDEESVEVD